MYYHNNNMFKKRKPTEESSRVMAWRRAKMAAGWKNLNMMVPSEMVDDLLMARRIMLKKLKRDKEQ